MSIYFDQEEFIKFVFQFESHLACFFADVYTFPEIRWKGTIGSALEFQKRLNGDLYKETSFLLEYGNDWQIIAVRHNDGFYVFDNSLAARKSLMEK